MEYPALERSSLFRGLSATEIEEAVARTPHHVRDFARGQTVFHLMDVALEVALVLEGRLEAQKSFPNGSQVNVSVRVPGEMVGPAAALSQARRYPCDIVALDAATLMMLATDDLLALMQRDARILRNVTCELASATYMLQQRLELLSYGGIAQKAAFWILTQARRTGSGSVVIPGSVSRWAMQMNVSRPSLHRELRRMEDAGAIVYAPPIIEIADAGALEDILGR